MKHPVSIVAIGSLSALGKSSEEVWQSYMSKQHFFTNKEDIYAAFLSEAAEAEIEKIRAGNAKYRHLDLSVLYAISVARTVYNSSGWKAPNHTGINIGSSRGATALFEKYHSEFLKSGKTATPASPTTTLGNISSWVAQDLQSHGPQFSHSITCSTAMHAILNGVAWLQSGMAAKFIAGGTEAALTAFTIAQMKAMKIYSDGTGEFPCQALNMQKKKNTMILAEGAGIVALENGKLKNAQAYIIGLGYANEALVHGASISTAGDCLQKSMKMAIGELNLSKIDAVVTHTPGTIGGDQAELNAIDSVFKEKIPAITTNKWQIGHSFAASGILSLEMAILMLQKQEFLKVPFSEFNKQPKKLETILVNAVGFGGNAVSLVITRNSQKT